MALLCPTWKNGGNGGSSRLRRLLGERSPFGLAMEDRADALGGSAAYGGFGGDVNNSPPKRGVAERFTNSTKRSDPPSEAIHQAKRSTNSPNSPAFTLVELLVVISIIGILTGLSIPSFNSFTRSQRLKQSAKQIKSDLRAAQNMALSGVERATADGWGVKFIAGSGTYNFCRYDETTGNCTNTTSVNLPSGIVIRGGSDTVVFKVISGVVVFKSGDGLIEVGYTSGGTQRIRVTLAGNIEEE